MGIYGALSTAVTGLRAQSFALENISGNIANSQTTGFKRIDTDFLDLIPDQPSKVQTSGSVLAQSKSTNTQAGDVKSVSNSTYMAVSGSGFFVVEPSIGQSDGASVFGGSNFYTRRGDFDINKNGYLVNGSGYYLKGLPIDRTTGNIASSLPQVIQVSNSFLPAAPTSRVTYQLNLPQLPKNGQYQASKTSGSELLKPQDFTTIANDTSASATGAAALTGDASTNVATAGDTLVVKLGAGAAVTMTFTNTGAATTGTNIDLTTTPTVGGVLAALSTANPGVTFALNGSGKIVATAAGTSNSLTITDNTTGATTGMGFTNGPTAPSVSQTLQLSSRASTIKAKDSDSFINESISGGAITVYASNGAPANVQMRWAKIGSSDVGGTDRWNLFYLSDSSATGSATMWKNVGTDYTFASDGTLSPALTSTDLTGVTVDGVSLGNIKLNFGTSGITQFSDPNGTAGVTALSQNGYPAGQYSSVSINDSGRVVVSYDNGQTVEIAQVVTADFNAANELKRMDGGIFAATADSGEPILDSTGGVIGSSLESSNTDISEEFTKLIVTQQAYAAGTKIVSTADQMLQQALNMIR
ncbi:MAG: flagellar hook-basal body complex protein [Devosia sp.]